MLLLENNVKTVKMYGKVNLMQLAYHLSILPITRANMSGSYQFFTLWGILNIPTSRIVFKTLTTYHVAQQVHFHQKGRVYVMQTSLIEVLKIRNCRKDVSPIFVQFSLKWPSIVKIFMILSNKNLTLLMKTYSLFIFGGRSSKERICITDRGMFAGAYIKPDL